MYVKKKDSPFVNYNCEKGSLINKQFPDKSIPVKIPMKGKLIMNNCFSEYSLKQNNFNPDKSSPPNSWDRRLMSRLYQQYKEDKK